MTGTKCHNSMSVISFPSQQPYQVSISAHKCRNRGLVMSLVERPHGKVMRQVGTQVSYGGVHSLLSRNYEQVCSSDSNTPCRNVSWHPWHLHKSGEEKNLLQLPREMSALGAFPLPQMSGRKQGFPRPYSGVFRVCLSSQISSLFGAPHASPTSPEALSFPLSTMETAKGWEHLYSVTDQWICFQCVRAKCFSNHVFKDYFYL